MHIYFDESGDYAFPADHFDAYVQAALICPDSLLGEIEEFVAGRREAWGVDELHAVELNPEQLLEIAGYIGESEMHLLANVTDSMMVTPEAIANYRLEQVATTRRNLDRYRRGCAKIDTAPDPQIEAFMDRMMKRAGLRTQISDGEFIQAVYLTELIFGALQKAIYFFHEGQWREDLRDFNFVIDGKLPAKMAAGEKYLNETILPILGSRPDEGLGVPETWKSDPPHPFVERFSVEHGRVAGRDVEGAIDLRGIFEHGLRFLNSAEHAGLQLVDAVAYIIRRAVLEPDNSQIQQAMTCCGTSSATTTTGH